MAKYVYLCALIVAVSAYIAVVHGDATGTESPLADLFNKLQSITANVSAAGKENFEKLQENLAPLFSQLKNASEPLVANLNEKFGANSTFVAEVKKQFDQFTSKSKSVGSM